MASRKSRLLERIPGGLQPAPGTDQRPSTGQGIDGAAAAQIAAHRTRDHKELLSPEEVLRRHRELAAQHGHQADKMVAEAREHVQQQRQRHDCSPDKAAQRAVTYARDHVFERSAVARPSATFWKRRSTVAWAQATSTQVRQEFECRVQAGEFRAVEHTGRGPAVHDRRDAAHGARDHRPHARRQPARL